MAILIVTENAKLSRPKAGAMPRACAVRSGSFVFLCEVDHGG